MKRYFFIAALAAAALVSCEKAETETVYTPDTANAVKFKVENLGTYAFKSPTVALGETGTSTVGIYAADLGANNVQATVNGNALTPASTIYWGVGQSAATEFVARYPYYAGATISDAYDIPADQSSEDAYTYQANFMSAVQSATPDPGTVAFNFTHPFAKIVINVTNNLGADAVASVVMKQMKLNATTLDLTSAPASATLAETLSDVTAYAASATEFDLIVMPQSATSAMDIVVTTTLGSVYTFRITGDYTFEAGKVATAAVTLNPTDGEGGSRTAVGDLTFDTTDWAADDDTTVGAVGDPTVGSYYQIGGCVYATADKGAEAWAKYYNMLYTAENTWTVTLNYDATMTDDESGKGFVIRQGENYYGMWTGSDYVTSGDYTLEPTDETHKNIKLETAGNYTITYNSSTRIISYVRNGDAE